MTDEILRVAAKAVITDKNGKVLILREANTYEEGTNAGCYEIPGGRLNPGESFNDGLKREAKEETGLAVEPLYPLFVGEWKPVIKGKPHHIFAIFTVCEAETFFIKLSDEHDEYKWIDEHEISSLDIAPPDDKVLRRYFQWQKTGLPNRPALEN